MNWVSFFCFFCCCMLICIAEDPYVYDVDNDYQPQRKSSRAKKDKAVSYFSKVYLYYNSRLPSQLPPLRLYVPLHMHDADDAG